MKRNIRLMAILMAAVMLLSTMTACGNTWAASYEDEQVPAGVYIYFVLEQFESLLNTGIVTNASELSEVSVGDLTAEESINENAMKAVKSYITVNRMFEEQNLTIDQETYDYMLETAKLDYAAQAEYFNECGMAESSYILANVDYTLKAKALFDAKYGVSGTDAVSESTLLSFFHDNYGLENFIYFLPYNVETYEMLAEDDEEVKAVMEEFEGYLKTINKGGDFASIAANYGADDVTQRTGGYANYLIEKDSADPTAPYLFDIEENKGKIVYDETNGYYMLINRLPLDDANNTSFENYRYSLLVEYKYEEFQDELASASDLLDIEFNNNTLKSFSIKNLDVSEFTTLALYTYETETGYTY